VLLFSYFSLSRRAEIERTGAKSIFKSRILRHVGEILNNLLSANGHRFFSSKTPCRKFFSSKIFLVENFFRRKFFSAKNFFVENCFGRKLTFVEKNFDEKNFRRKKSVSIFH